MTNPADLPGREPIQIFELDQPVCSRTYGDLSGGCTAVLGTTGAHRCYNTFGTCQVQTVYALDEGPVTLRFCTPHAGVPRDQYLIPTLAGISTIPARLNFGARLGRDSRLGRRPRITVTLQDSSGADTRVDPYLELRGWDPLERGTWWAKWMRRNPHHAGMVVRIREGWAGQALEDMRVSEYRLERAEGPDSSGRVTLTLTDPVGIALNTDAAYPKPIRATFVEKRRYPPNLMVVIENAGPLAPGHGPGVVQVDDEIITFTETVDYYPSGDNPTYAPEGGAILSGCEYGAYSTTDAEHTAGTDVQAVLAAWNRGAAEVVREILEEGAGFTITAAELADWAAEYTAHVPSYLIYKILPPTKVRDLLAGLAEQAGFVLWWDPETATVRMRAAYRTETPAITLTDAHHLLAGSVRVTQRPEERATEVWVFWLPRSGADETDPESYQRITAQVDQVASSPHAYGDRRPHEILAPWIIDADHAAWLAENALTRYSGVPEYLTFAVDARLEDVVTPGAVVDVQHRAFVDATGAAETRRYQVISVNRKADTLEVEARPWEDPS